MPLLEVARVEDLPPGTSTEVIVGVDTYVVCNHEGTLHALDGICPHRNGPLGAGNYADGMLICPYHGWEFSCVTGEYDRNPDVKLKKFPVKVKEGLIYILA
ncbi:MAG: Rieske (2Fe-2S) protein [Acidobacteria bacterium]|nr:Rieske (2Fe-2S) protein [Acidobacteriota bacterium]